MLVKFLFFCLLFFFGFLPKQAAASIEAVPSPLPQVLIVNQVRGQECCQPGRLDFFKEQVEFFQKNEIPVIFNLRYDALIDPAYQAVIRSADSELFTWGLFLEVTPELATAAGVKYLGQEKNWYEAQHAYTLGYSAEERQLLVDELMRVYDEFFEQYPLVTTSWILDTSTVNYLHQKYQVKIHQITREQWGTDSYTLFGGPPHYPYFASNNWAFMPAKNSHAEESMLIVRQTLTDPVWNYGDTQSRFTSQPNDFMQDGKDFTYFKRLVEQALFQQPAGQRGFALLGLENSMPAQYQKVYQQQLELLNNWAEQKLLDFSKPVGLIETVKNDQVKIYHGQDLVNDQQNTATWIRARNYRLRLMKKGRRLMIDDLRLYDANLNDYYADQQAALRAYWIAPFLIDGSRFYTQEETWFRKQQASDGLEPLPDQVTTPQAWHLPDLATAETELEFEQTGNGQIVINYQTAEGHFSLRLAPTRFGLGLKADAPPRDRWTLNNQVVYELRRSCEPEYCWYQPWLDVELFSQAQLEQRKPFLPEQRSGQLDPVKSQLYAHNPFAIAGRNPVRLVFIPRDSRGLAVQLEQPPEILVESSEVTLETDPATVLTTSPQFYDFSSQEPIKTTVTFKVADQLELTSQLHFAPNCKTEWSSCWQQPRYWWWFGRSWLQHQRQLIEEKWQSWLNY